jgi:hypothetical protein
LRRDGGLTTIAMVAFARAYVSRSVSARRPVSRLPGSRSTSMPRASTRAMMRRPCAWSYAAAVATTRLGVQRRAGRGGGATALRSWVTTASPLALCGAADVSDASGRVTSTESNDIRSAYPDLRRSILLS